MGLAIKPYRGTIAKCVRYPSRAQPARAIGSTPLKRFRSGSSKVVLTLSWPVIRPEKARRLRSSRRAGEAESVARGPSRWSSLGET